MTRRVAAFGALNQGSYDMFGHYLAQKIGAKELRYMAAAPYPNAHAESEPGRPLRREALKDTHCRAQLIRAVAADARAVDALAADVRCMPCMSMLAFHDEVERELGVPIISLATALQTAYADVDAVGVIHMPPARDRINDIFGDKALSPDAAFLAQLEEAEGNAELVYTIMRDIVTAWRDQGLSHVLFARADAPMADTSVAAKVDGIHIRSVFDCLADAVARQVDG
ncbi:MAG: hypothetical protein OXT65_13115 [Alphaproteobacteria bacterium]|nr:hypothetical protein [Alphaproteobacteria bacterium]